MFKIESVRNYKNVAIIGCGGTGSLLAEGLCRLLPNDIVLTLVDHDRVEEHNLLRQNFHKGELGQFKSEALARRLASIYGRQIRYSVLPYTDSHIYSLGGLLVGCVDNPAARTEISKNNYRYWYWLDVGNGYNSGQILIGNVREKRDMFKSFDVERGVCQALPIPSWQQPSLLEPVEPRQHDCAEAVERGDQSPTINQLMATLALEFIRRFFDGTLMWMGLYVDLDAGSMRLVDIDIPTVSRITGVSTRSLVGKK